jgi:crotonobetainyl-CoA:carnitine CoA-transferase CaiB-like acyl-CoA transferase
MPKKPGKPRRRGTAFPARRKRTSLPKPPLEGITVLDLSSYIAGPYGSTLLADLGANVIKIEPPAGDTLRLYPSTLPNESRAFLGINRSKRGMVLDLKQPAGLHILRRMLRTAEVLIHNFRPSVPARLGVDYPKLEKLNPRLVYCALSGYGESGPMKNKAGYDQVLQSMTGICTSQGNAGGNPQIVYGSIVDFYAASLLAYGAVAALYQRERTGKGQFVAVSLLRTALAMQSGRFVWAESEPPNVNRDLRSGGITEIHPTKSGGLYLSANTAAHRRRFCYPRTAPWQSVSPRPQTPLRQSDRPGEPSISQLIPN